MSFEVHSSLVNHVSWGIAYKNIYNSILKTFSSHQSNVYKLSDAPQKILLGDRGAQGAEISALF